MKTSRKDCFKDLSKFAYTPEELQSLERRIYDLENPADLERAIDMQNDLNYSSFKEFLANETDYYSENIRVLKL